MKIIKPPRINNGETIGVIALSIPITECKEEVIQKGYRILKNHGLKVVEHPQCRKIYGHSAGTIEDRVRAIHEFFENKEISCIMTFLGGYNSNQLLEYINYDLIKRNPKIFIGFSDTTSLLLGIYKKTGLITFMGPSVISFAKPDFFEYTWSSFSDTCVKPKKKTVIGTPKYYADDAFYLRKDDEHRKIKKNDGVRVFRVGSARGKIVAANIETLGSVIDTPYCPSFIGRILFLEGSEETNTAQLHHYLTGLRQQGVFSKIKGIVFGKFATNSGFNKADRLEDVLEDILKGLNIPVLYDVSFGHTDPIATIPIGTSCLIDTKTRKIQISRSVI